MSFSANSNLWISSRSMLIDRLFFSLWVMLFCFLACLAIWLDAEFYLSGCWVFLYFYKSFWALFRDTVKLLGNSFILSSLLWFVRWAWIRVQSITEARPSRDTSNPGPWDLRGFTWWPMRAQLSQALCECPHCLLQSSQGSLSWASSSFLTCLFCTLLNIWDFLQISRVPSLQLPPLGTVSF